MKKSAQTLDQPYVMITGGCGFIGTNLAHALLKSGRFGRSVLLFDNLDRPSVKKNRQWLSSEHGKKVQVKVADVRSRYALREAVQNAGQVFHLAEQVPVTSSLLDTAPDFTVNVQGTINLLEELRRLKNPPPLLYASTNKVYGSLSSINLRKNNTRYEPIDPLIRLKGIHEDYPLSFHTHYSCSKGAAEQYVIDYSRTFHLPAVVLRMSSIYGPHQFGTDDQGKGQGKDQGKDQGEDHSWVAHFLMRALEKRPITLYGDGRQVRDILFVEDLVEAFILAITHIQELSGQVFNIGGGHENSLSLLEFIDLITEIHHEKPHCIFSQWQAGEQWYYVSDITRFHLATGWYPKVGVRQGVENLNTWLHQARDKFSEALVAN